MSHNFSCCHHSILLLKIKLNLDLIILLSKYKNSTYTFRQVLSLSKFLHNLTPNMNKKEKYDNSIIYLSYCA